MKEKFQKTGKYLRRVLATALAGFVFTTSAYAQPVEIKTPKTKIELYLNKNPKTDADANTKLTSSAANILGRGIEYGSQKSGLENSVFGRVAELGADTFATRFFGKASHESGHYREASEAGAEDLKLNIDLNPFERGSYSYSNIEGGNIDNQLRIIIGGPNQDSLNALNQFRESQLHSTKPYEELDKSLTRLFQAGYVFISDEEMDDYFAYEKKLNEKGLNVSLDQMKLNASLAFAGSFNNWKSLGNIWNFVKYGKREFEPAYFSLTDNLKVGLPDFGYFLTPNGEFIEMSEFAKWKNKTFEVNVANSISGDLNTLRVGGKIYDIPITDNFSVSPYAHLDFERDSFSFNGFQAGGRVDYKINKNLSLFLEGEYNQDDLIADVKGKENGLGAQVGVSCSF